MDHDNTRNDDLVHWMKMIARRNAQLSLIESELNDLKENISFIHLEFNNKIANLKDRYEDKSRFDQAL